MKNEQDVRRWLKRHWPGAVAWVEPSAGSTVGLPDSVIFPGGGRTVWLELKYGRTTQAGVVRYHVRPIQRLQMNRLLRLGVEVGVLVGSDEGQVWVLQAVPEAFEGRLDVRGSLPKWSRAVEDRKSLLKVVNFGYLSPDVHPKLLRA